MFAISIDIDASIEQLEEIRSLMLQYGFVQQAGGFFLTVSTDMTSLFYAMNALKSTPWFVASVRDIRAFKVEDWSNFTQFMKE